MANTWSEYVANGQAFAAENFLVGVGGTFAEIQLFNPVASGVRVRLRSAHNILVLGAGIALRRHDVALATLGLPAGFIVENLLGGGPAEAAEMRSAAPVAVDGTTMWQMSAPPNIPAIYPGEGREWGMDLLEGQGVLMQAAAGTTIIINWHWVEVPL
jgi:hypothetical protein